MVRKIAVRKIFASSSVQNSTLIWAEITELAFPLLGNWQTICIFWMSFSLLIEQLFGFLKFPLGIFLNF